MMKADIYPTIWDRDPEDDDTLGWLVEFFSLLKPFVEETVEKNEGLIISLS